MMEGIGVIVVVFSVVPLKERTLSKYIISLVEPFRMRAGGNGKTQQGKPAVEAHTAHLVERRMLQPRLLEGVLHCVDVVVVLL